MPIPTPPQAKTPGITVFIAKKCVTMDPGWPEATAVAVMGGKILSVGVTFDDLKPWLDKYPYDVNDQFKDKVIYPGFIEAIPSGDGFAGAEQAVSQPCPDAQPLWRRHSRGQVARGSNLDYFSALMQQAGVTTAGDLFFDGDNMELEQQLSRNDHATDAPKARIVHAIDGFATQLYWQ